MATVLKTELTNVIAKDGDRVEVDSHNFKVVVSQEDSKPFVQIYFANGEGFDLKYEALDNENEYSACQNHI